MTSIEIDVDISKAEKKLEKLDKAIKDAYHDTDRISWVALFLSLIALVVALIK